MIDVYEEEKFNREHQNDVIKATDIGELKMTNNPCKFCDRCKRIIASAQCNKKPREDEVSICRDCAVEMWTKEKET